MGETEDKKTRYFRTGAFARKAAVTLRTLRFYDRVGLLSPSRHTESGYRLYSENDLLILQQILALKFLGFSLDEISSYLKRHPVAPGNRERFAAALAEQKEMLLDKSRQIETILAAIERTQDLLQSGEVDWESVVTMILALQREEKGHWLRKYLNPAQLHQIEQLHQRAYSQQAQERLQAREPWTEEQQRSVSDAWRALIAEAERLAASGADPGGPEGQRLVQTRAELIRTFTGGDPEIEEGFRRFWEAHQSLPPEQRPLQAFTPSLSPDAARFLADATARFEPAEHRAPPPEEENHAP